MTTIDTITQYCIYCDYPFFRRNIEYYRQLFNKIILYPSRHHGVLDLEKFAREQIKETWIDNHVIDWTTPGIDWRQAETEPCLEKSTAEWIWFVEQDFFVKNWDKFFEDIQGKMRDNDMIGLWNPTHYPYIHPSCLFIKRELLEQTKKDFRAHPEIDGADHFSQITHDAMELGARIVKIQDMGWTEDKAMHLGGLTYVYQNFKDDFSNPIGCKYPKAFAVYNKLQRHVLVEQNEDFIKLTRKVDDQLHHEGIYVNQEEIKKWGEFFQW